MWIYEPFETWYPSNAGAYAGFGLGGFDICNLTKTNFMTIGIFMKFVNI